MSDEFGFTGLPCHYFAEGSGFIYVAELGIGSQGQTQLVRRASDGTLFVRKVRYGEGLMTYDEYTSQQRETLIGDQSIYDIQPLERSGTIWQFCNGGDLKSLIDKYQDHFEEQEEWIPEALIWKFFSEALETLDYLHTLDPAIVHRDLVAANIFCDWFDDTSRLPEFYIGDFGMATEVNPGDAPRYNLFAEDFRALADLVLEVIGRPGQSGPHRRDFDRQNLPYSANLFKLVDRLDSMASAQISNLASGPLQLRSIIRTLRLKVRNLPSVHGDIRWTKPIVNSSPMLYESVEAACAAPVTGPWYVAIVSQGDSVTSHGLYPSSYSNPPQTIGEDVASGGMTFSEWQQMNASTDSQDKANDEQEMTVSEEEAFAEFQEQMP